MEKEAYCQESKEFQLKVIWPASSSPTQAARAVIDRQIFQHMTQAIAAAVLALAGKRQSTLTFNDNLWRRQGIRFDTAGGELKQHNLTLAIEATDERSKLKCKQHHFIPEMLFEKPKKSVCYPDLKIAGRYKKNDGKLKLEQDLHFSNLKYCASGSLFIKGPLLAADNIRVFSRYFPALEKRFPPATALHEVSHWDEAVFDDMRTAWDDAEIPNWMLVNRWDWASGELLESELSFKLDKAMADQWDFKTLQAADKLYRELKKSGLFKTVPPIFFYDDPVSSQNIVLV